MPLTSASLNASVYTRPRRYEIASSTIVDGWLRLQLVPMLMVTPPAFTVQQPSSVERSAKEIFMPDRATPGLVGVVPETDEVNSTIFGASRVLDGPTNVLLPGETPDGDKVTVLPPVRVAPFVKFTIAFSFNAYKSTFHGCAFFLSRGVQPDR